MRLLMPNNCQHRHLLFQRALRCDTEARSFVSRLPHFHPTWATQQRSIYFLQVPRRTKKAKSATITNPRKNIQRRTFILGILKNLLGKIGKSATAQAPEPSFFKLQKPSPSAATSLPHPQRAAVTETKAVPEIYRPRYPPGIPIIYQLTTYLDRKVGKAPSDNELIEAFEELVEWYSFEGPGKRIITDEHAYALLRVYEYLERRNTGPPANGRRWKAAEQQGEAIDFPLETLRATLKLLQKAKTEHEEELGAYLFYSISRKCPHGIATAEDYHDYIKLLASRENYDEIFILSTDTLVEEMIRGCESPIDLPTWRKIIDALSNRPGIDEYSTDNLAKYGVPTKEREGYYEVLYFAKANNWSLAYECYAKRRDSGYEHELATYELVIGGCSPDKAREVLQDLLEKTERAEGPASGGAEARRQCWKTILQLASSNGAAAVKGLLKRMVAAAEGQIEASTQSPLPDIDLLNDIVEFQLRQKNEKIAGEILQLESERPSSPKFVISLPFPPNRRTRSLKMQCYVGMGELELARVAYQSLHTNFDLPDANTQSQEASSVLRLLGAKRHPKPKDIQTMSLMLADLHERNIPISLNAISSLIECYLIYGHFTELIRLWETNIQDAVLSFSERKEIIQQIIDFIHSPKASLLASWDAYQFLHRSVPLMEVTADQRVQLMDLFFDLGRPDLATIVFTHTEQLWTTAAYPLRPSKDPNALKKTPVLDKDFPSLLTSSVSHQLTPKKKEELYIHMFRGLSSLGNKDFQTLHLVHNHLNTDPHMPAIPSTLLLNSLMAAYARVGMYERAARFWGTIRKSKGGPDAESISLILSICGRRNGWLEHGKKIWKGMKKMGISATRENLAAYVEMVGRNGEGGEGWKAVQEAMMEEALLRNKMVDKRFVKDELGITGSVKREEMILNEEFVTTLYNWIPRNHHPTIETWIVNCHSKLLDRWTWLQRKCPYLEVDRTTWDHLDDEGQADEHFGEFDEDGDKSWRW